MVFQDLVNQIKTEGRIASDSEFDPMVIGLINELFKEAVESERPFELRADIVLALTTATATVALPADFFIHHQVFYQDADTGRTYQLTDEDKAVPPAPMGLYGHPKSFEVVTSGQIILKPSGAIVTGDSVLLIYYKKPPEITQASLINANLIPRLEPFLVRGVIRRIRMFHSDDLQVAQMLSGDIQSAGQGYSKDSPERSQKSGS